MDNKPKIEIEKINIPDIKSEVGSELSEKDQDKVSGGGGAYGYNSGGNYS